MYKRQLPQILKLDIGGNPHSWITYEQSAYYYAKELVAWSMGEVDVTLHGGTNAVSGRQSTLTMNTIIAVRGKMSDKQQAAARRVPLTNKTLFRRDRNLCAYCGNMFTSSILTRDHIIPSSRGGANSWTNCVTSCASCNKYKDNRTPEEAHMHLLYVPYAPNKAELLILHNHKILADQMDFLMARVTEHSRLREAA